MIANCPECQTRYRVADDRIGPKGARIRCQKCQTVFSIDPPDLAQEVEAQPIEYVACALVAEANADTAKTIASFLETWAVEMAGVSRLAAMKTMVAVHVDQERRWRLIKDFSEKESFYLIPSVVE